MFGVCDTHQMLSTQISTQTMPATKSSRRSHQARAAATQLWLNRKSDEEAKEKSHEEEKSLLQSLQQTHKLHQDHTPASSLRPPPLQAFSDSDFIKTLLHARRFMQDVGKPKMMGVNDSQWHENDDGLPPLQACSDSDEDSESDDDLVLNDSAKPMTSSERALHQPVRETLSVGPTSASERDFICNARHVSRRTVRDALSILSTIGLILDPSPGDGHCLFTSVWKGFREMNLSCASAHDLRGQVGAFMLAHRHKCGGDNYEATCTEADVSAGMPPTWEAYAEGMKGLTKEISFSQWGGELELQVVMELPIMAQGLPACTMCVMVPDASSSVRLGIYRFHSHHSKSRSFDDNDRLSIYEVLDEQKLAALPVVGSIYLWRVGNHFDHLTLRSCADFDDESATLSTHMRTSSHNTAETTCSVPSTISTTCSVQSTVVSTTCSVPPTISTTCSQPPVVPRPVRVRLKETEKHCSFEQCPSRAHHLLPAASFQFHRIQAGRTAGGQDWSSLEGQILCGSCMGYFSKYGSLVRGFKGKVVRRRKAKTKHQCDYEHCPLSSSLASYYLVVQEARSAGGKDWSQVVGMRLCGRCLQYFSKFGVLDRKGRGAEQRRKRLIGAIATVDDTESSGHDDDSFSCRDDSDLDRQSKFSIRMPLIASATTEVIEPDNDAISESRRRCSYAQCPRPDESCRFPMIEEGYRAGTNRDWTHLKGMILCHACCEFFKKYGTLQRGLPRDERPALSDSRAVTGTVEGAGWQEEMDDRDGDEVIGGRLAERKVRPSDVDPDALTSEDSDEEGIVWEGRGKNYKPLPIPNVQGCVKPQVEKTAFQSDDATQFDIDAFTVGNADVRSIKRLGYVWQLASYIPSKGISLHAKDQKWDILITVAPMQMVCKLPPRWISFPGEFIRRLCLLLSVRHKYVMPDDDIDSEDHKGPWKISRNGQTRMIPGELLQFSLQEMGVRRISMAVYGMGELCCLHMISHLPSTRNQMSTC